MSSSSDSGTSTLETLRDGNPASQVAAMPRSHLFVVVECDRPLAGGARYGLDRVDQILIGRGKERTATRRLEGGIRRLFVTVPGRSMSSSHARILRADDGWVLEDTASTNGSFVNGVRVEHAILADGDIIELGHTLFVVRDGLPTPERAEQDLDAGGAEGEPQGLMTLLPFGKVAADVVDKVARSKIPVLLLGETGTGKEVLARDIHRLSGRVGAFVAVNCGALPSSLVEAIFFGHAKGAFTGALRDELGLVRAADGGTLLLDEIGDLPLDAQAVLLRFLQEGEVTPVGSTRPLNVDVRVVAATHRSLDQLAASGKFRADLLARLNGYVHYLAPLRERREDIGLIAGCLLRKHGLDRAPVMFLPELGRRLLEYCWPANVRELEQGLVRGVVLAAGAELDANHVILSGGVIDRAGRRAPAPDKTRALLDDADEKLRAELVVHLAQCGGNIAEVAKAFGKARMQIHRWMKRFDIDPTSFRK
ncbi:MAG TPA: sigma 54-interacting transcriptional regulator [Polyangiaceae bacterium]|nr:sigma 54-interacting transcriptional regulator [Polyangiaceae bacterium]